LHFLPPAGCVRIGLINFILAFLIPFMSWTGTLTWAIIYRLHLMEQEKLKKVKQNKAKQ